MMPKSIAARRPSGRANRLPWWRSAWKKPSTTAWRRKARTRIAASAFRSWPASISASRSVSLMPSIHSRVITRRAVRLQSIAGTKKPLSASRFSRELGGGGGLLAQVELAVGPLPEGGDDQPRPQPRGLAAHRLDLRGRPFIGVDRGGEILLDVRAAAP